MSASLKVILMFGFVTMLVLSVNAHARPYSYPQIRYQGALNQSMGGVSLALSEELGNNLFNNPAGLSRNTKFRAEYLNLNLEANSNVLGSLGLSTPKMTGLGGMTDTLNSNHDQVFGAGLSNVTALSWGGLAAGLMIQERVRAASDGTNVRYETMSQIVPAVGYGLGLARGVVRFGYTVQYVNQASGLAQSAANSSASFLDGINQGWGLSHNASVNFIFPFTYLPTFSLAARNIGGLHYNSGSLFARAKNPVGIPQDESMGVDASMGWMVRIAGTFKSNWYIETRDLTNTAKMPVLERLSFGVDFALNPAFSLRGGFTGDQPSAGLGYRSQASEINLAWYAEPNALANTSHWDTRYTLQYKLFFQNRNVRDRDAEKQK
jgi:hypothetical protein